MSSELDNSSQSQETKAKFKQKECKLHSKSINPEVGPGVWKRLRGKNEIELGTKIGDLVPDIELKGDDRFRWKAFVHFDCQSIGFDINNVLTHRKQSNNFTNVSTGASAVSGTQQSYATETDDPDINANLDDGDGCSNELVQSCSFFRNEIGGEEERIIGLTQTNRYNKYNQVQINRYNKYNQTSRERKTNTNAIILNRSPGCCGVTILDCSLSPVGHILPPHITCKGHIIEYLDTGAYYYQHFFNGQEHQNYFGIDDNYGPIAVSIKREKLNERENNLGKCESGLYQYRIIFRTSELTALRGAILEDAIPASGRFSSSRGIPAKDLLEFLVPEIQTTCLCQAISGQKTSDQLMKLDEQRNFATYKIGILYCKSGQTTEEEMYNNEVAGPIFEEFLLCIGEKVRLKGFKQYRAQLDNKTDSTGTHSIYTTFNNCEIMFHVSTMLPFSLKNPQQLLRKRHIGNNIVTIIFQEPGAPPFTPKSVRSQFQHVFIIVRAYNPCSDKTTYSIAVSRSKDVPPFGPTIPVKAMFHNNREFTEFLLAKVINAENAAIHSEKFSAMAVRTRQEYLKDLAQNYVTSNSLESASKFSKLVSGKKKEKNHDKLIPDNFALGAIVWHVLVDDVGQSTQISSFLGIAAETLVIIEESSKDVIFTIPCATVIGWTSQACCLRLFFKQGEFLIMQPVSGDMEELQEIITRLRAITCGCETEKLSLKRNGLGQLGFHIQAEGIVTDVEHYGFAAESGLLKGTRLVEICKVATVTLSHDQMVDLLRTSATVKVVVIPPLKNGCPRGEIKSPPNRNFYVTENTPWLASSLNLGTPTHAVLTSNYHGYQDSTLSSGQVSLLNGRGDIADHFSSSSRGLDNSSYSTLEEKHKNCGSKHSLDQNINGSGKEWGARSQLQRPNLPKETSSWQESISSLQTTCITNSTENIFNTCAASSSAPSIASCKPSNQSLTFNFQHDNYAQELMEKSLITECLLGHVSDLSRMKTINSTNSSSLTLSDTSFSSGGSIGANAANMPQSGSHTNNSGFLRDRSRDDISGGRRHDNLSSFSQGIKSNTSGVGRRAELTVSPLSSEHSSPRSSHKNLSGMSSDESLSTRLQPGVTGTYLTKSKVSNNFQEDLMRLIDPDIAERDLSGLLTRKLPNCRLVRTMSDKSLHSAKGSTYLCDYDLQETNFNEKKQELKGNREQLRNQRLSPRATSDIVTSVPMLKSMTMLDWSSLVDVATKAIENVDPDSKDRYSYPLDSTTSSSMNLANKTKKIKIESVYCQKIHNQLPDPPTTSNPPVWSVLANPQVRIQELEAKVAHLEEELAQERQESAALDLVVQRLQRENARLQDESQSAAAQLRKFTEWFFRTIDRQ